MFEAVCFHFPAACLSCEQLRVHLNPSFIIVKAATVESTERSVQVSSSAAELSPSLFKQQRATLS